MLFGVVWRPTTDWIDFLVLCTSDFMLSPVGLPSTATSPRWFFRTGKWTRPTISHFWLFEMVLRRLEMVPRDVRFRLKHLPPSRPPLSLRSQEKGLIRFRHQNISQELMRKALYLRWTIAEPFVFVTDLMFRCWSCVQSCWMVFHFPVWQFKYAYVSSNKVLNSSESFVESSIRNETAGVALFEVESSTEVLLWTQKLTYKFM